MRDSLLLFQHAHRGELVAGLLALLALWLAGAAVRTWLAVAAGLPAGLVAWHLWLGRRGRSLPCRADCAAAAARCGTLSADQLLQFDRNGYIVLRQVVLAAAAKEFARKQIWPGLNKQGIYPDRPDGWHKGAKWEAAYGGSSRCIHCLLAPCSPLPNRIAMAKVQGGRAAGNSAGIRGRQERGGQPQRAGLHDARHPS